LLAQWPYSIRPGSAGCRLLGVAHLVVIRRRMPDRRGEAFEHDSRPSASLGPRQILLIARC